MKRFIAVALVAAQLAGCAFNLGYASREGTSLTQGELELAVMNCRQDAEVAWDGGHDVAAFLMGMTIIGLVPAMLWEKDVKKDAYRECMASRGLRVVDGQPRASSVTVGPPPPLKPGESYKYPNLER